MRTAASRLVCLEASALALKQVTIGAAGRLGKVFAAIGVASEAGGACSARRIPMAAVAAAAILVLGLGVQARQFSHDVARRARGRRSDATRPVRAMATEATAGQLPVRRRSLNRVTRGALNLGRRTRVRLMTIDARLVPRRRTGNFQ